MDGIFTLLTSPNIDLTTDAFTTLRVKTTLETSGKDAKLHSKRVEKMQNYTRNGWKRFKTTLETSGEDCLGNSGFA